MSPDCKICDNIDLDTIYLDFCSYYHLRFGKLPKIVKKIENDSNDTTFPRNKLNKNRSAENTAKLSEEYQKKVKKELKESTESSADSNSKTNLVVTGSISSAGDDANHGETTLRTYQRNTDLFKHFLGESRELAYVIEKSVNF